MSATSVVDIVSAYQAEDRLLEKFPRLKDFSAENGNDIQETIDDKDEDIGVTRLESCDGDVFVYESDLDKIGETLLNRMLDISSLKKVIVSAFDKHVQCCGDLVALRRNVDVAVDNWAANQK